MMKWARPLSRSASASQDREAPCTLRFVGDGGGVVSDTRVSLTDCIHSLAMASLGNQIACVASPLKELAGTASVDPIAASQAVSFARERNSPPLFFGSRASRQASSQRIAI